MKRNPKVRCAHCGAKNTPAAACRICGARLPAIEVTEEERSFEENVESERAAWREYEQGKKSAPQA